MLNNDSDLAVLNKTRIRSIWISADASFKPGLPILSPKTLEQWSQLKPRRRRSSSWNNFVFFRFTNLESESSRALERAQAEEKKITELEEELRVVGSNLQQLEVEKTILVVLKSLH